MSAGALMTQQAAANRTKELQAKRGENPYAEGTRYHEMWNNNPYAWDKFTRKRSIWDDLAESWGIRSSYQAAEDEWMKAQSEYDAQIAQLKGEDEYNSPQAQAARMRAAGQNPDLLGTEGVAEAGEFAQEQTSPNVNVESEQLNRVTGFIDNVIKAVVTGVGLTNDIARSMGLFEELKTKKLDNAGKLEELADKFIIDYMPDAKDEGITPDDAVGQLTGYIDLFADNNHLSKKQRAQFENAVISRVHTHKGDVYDRNTRNYKSRKEWGLTRGNRYTPKTDNPDEILQIVGELTNKISTAEFHNLSAAANRAVNEDNYERELDGSLKARAENKENEASEKRNEFELTAKSAVDWAMKQLDPYSKKGNLTAIFLQSILPTLYLKLTK